MGADDPVCTGSGQVWTGTRSRDSVWTEKGPSLYWEVIRVDWDHHILDCEDMWASSLDWEESQPLQGGVKEIQSVLGQIPAATGDGARGFSLYWDEAQPVLGGDKGNQFGLGQGPGYTGRGSGHPVWTGTHHILDWEGMRGSTLYWEWAQSLLGGARGTSLH